MPREKSKTNWDDIPVVMDLPCASVILGFSVDCLKKKAQEGVFPAVKINNEWRITKAEVRKLVGLPPEESSSTEVINSINLLTTAVITLTERLAEFKSNNT